MWAAAWGEAPRSPIPIPINRENLMQRPDDKPQPTRGGRLSPEPADQDPHKDQPTNPDVDPDDSKTVQEREQALDDALDQTFPASDPPSTTPQPPARPKH